MEDEQSIRRKTGLTKEESRRQWQLVEKRANKREREMDQLCEDHREELARSLVNFIKPFIWEGIKGDKFESSIRRRVSKSRHGYFETEAGRTIMRSVHF
jgi:hypothetical protein